MGKATSLFSQLLSLFPKTIFYSLVKKHSSDRGAKGFSSWAHFVSMFFCQLAHSGSLRDICNGLKCSLGNLRHLGVMELPNKSTLSYANSHRPAAMFEEFFHEIYGHFIALSGCSIRKGRFKFKNKLVSIDSTVVELSLAIFPWADFNRTKGGVKVHTMLDHDSYMPSFVNMSLAKVHDVKFARILDLAPGTIVAMDKGYVDYALFSEWTRRGIFFVTRLKENAVYEIVEKRHIPVSRSNILSDEIIALSGKYASGKCPDLLRRIVVWDEKNKKELTLLTNHMAFGPTTISAIYKDRWEIELFFKALKQNLKIKTFVGTTENAIRIQIWTALIAMLLLKWMHFMSKEIWALSNLAYLLRINLFTHRDFWEWLHHPFENEPITPCPEQPVLVFA